MGWERRGTGTYYYGKERIGGTVRSIYLGTGAAGALAAEYAEDARMLRDFDRAHLTEARYAVAQAEALLVELDAATDAAVAGTLIGMGYRQHDRGEWRRRRGA